MLTRNVKHIEPLGVPTLDPTNDFLDALDDPNHERHEELIEWRGGALVRSFY